MDKIDFVLPWVDGSDEKWLASRRQYEAATVNSASSDRDANAACRYRDYGLLQYWFRGVERFAPWVNHIFLVTCGQQPAWLNAAHPKLRLVNHTDYIPAQWLPTFQSNAIELNLHRIPDLAERFVLFNDDLFLVRPVKPTFFFRKGYPVIPCDLGIPPWLGCTNISRIIINNNGIIKQSMNVNRLVWKNILKHINIFALGPTRAAKNLISFTVNRTLLLSTFGHLAQPHLKSTFEEIWRSHPRILEWTSQSRFRTDDSVNHWLASAWDLVSGRFYPANEKRLGQFITFDEGKIDEICTLIRRQTRPQFCLNEKDGTSNLDWCLRKVAEAFQEILPDKCAFEK